MCPQAFTIPHPSLKLEIKLEEIKKLHIHEEVLSANLQKLKEQILADQCVKHPVIVDMKTFVVLDGMHRLAAVESLVEYDNPEISVNRWVRVVKNSTDLEKLVAAVNDLGFTHKECAKIDAKKLMDSRKAITAIVSQSRCYTVFGPQVDIRENYDAIKRIESKLLSLGYSIDFNTDHDAQEAVALGRALAMLMVPNLLKTDVTEVALKGLVFAPKTTRHVIPVRPLFVNIPLSWLYGEVSLLRANEALLHHLSQKRVKRLPPGQVLDRRYEEELYIFE